MTAGSRVSSESARAGAPKGLRPLLVVEEDSDVRATTFTFDDILIWPYLRHRLLLEGLLLQSGAVHPHAGRRTMSLPDTCRYVWRSFAGSALWAPRRGFDALVFVSAISNFRVGDGYRNRVADYFANATPGGAMVVEESNRGQYSVPRLVDHLRYHDSLLMCAAAAGRMRPQPDRRLIEEYLQHVRSVFPMRLEESIWQDIESAVKRIRRRLDALHSMYNRLLDRVGVGVVMLEDACYGPRSHLIKWARDRGAVTCECQHGYVDSNHPAYNYAMCIDESDVYRAQLPDHFLAYGEYWASRVTMPVKIFVVGNPHFSQSVRELERTGSGRIGGAGSDTKRILVVSSGTNPELINSVIGVLLKTSVRSGWRLVLRVHPGERATLKERYKELLENGISVDMEDDLYRSLAQSAVVLGELSTVLFEAAALAIPVVMIETAYSRLFSGEQEEFPCGATGDELRVLVNEALESDPMPRKEYFADDWERNYQEYLAASLARPTRTSIGRAS